MNQKSRGLAPALVFGFVGLLLVAKERQHHHEHVDEVQIEAKRAHYGGLAEPLCVAVMGVCKVCVLDVLRVIGCEASEHENTNNAHREHKSRRANPNVDDGHRDDADQAHEQEAAPTRNVFLSCVAPEADGGDGRINGGTKR